MTRSPMRLTKPTKARSPLSFGTRRRSSEGVIIVLIFLIQTLAQMEIEQALTSAPVTHAQVNQSLSVMTEQLHDDQTAIEKRIVKQAVDEALKQYRSDTNPPHHPHDHH